MRRRGFHGAVLSAAWLAAAGASAQGTGKVGVLMMHGKNPGNPNDANFRPQMYRLEREGMLVVLPDMPWSATRYLDGDWDGAMQEIDRHVAGLREKGATRIVLMGHSMGCPAALAYAARKPDAVHAIVLFAPGHAPQLYYTAASLAAVRKSVDEAREMVAAGKGNERARFTDINQGRVLSVWTTPRQYLSFFDPASDADLGVSAPKVPASVPVLTVIGDADPLFRLVRSYYHDKLPANPKTRYLEVSANHLTTPVVAIEQAVAWLKDVLPAG